MLGMRLAQISWTGRSRSRWGHTAGGAKKQVPPRFPPRPQLPGLWGPDGLGPESKALTSDRTGEALHLYQWLHHPHPRFRALPMMMSHHRELKTPWGEGAWGVVASAKPHIKGNSEPTDHDELEDVRSELSDPFRSTHST